MHGDEPTVLSPRSKDGLPVSTLFVVGGPENGRKLWAYGRGAG